MTAGVVLQTQTSWYKQSRQIHTCNWPFYRILACRSRNKSLPLSVAMFLLVFTELPSQTSCLWSLWVQSSNSILPSSAGTFITIWQGNPPSSFMVFTTLTPRTWNIPFLSSKPTKCSIRYSPFLFHCLLKHSHRPFRMFAGINTVLYNYDFRVIVFFISQFYISFFQ